MKKPRIEVDDDYVSRIFKFINEGAVYIYGTNKFSIWNFKGKPWALTDDSKDRIELIRDRPTKFIFESRITQPVDEVIRHWEMHVVEPNEAFGLRYTIRFPNKTTLSDVMDKMRQFVQTHPLEIEEA